MTIRILVGLAILPFIVLGLFLYFLPIFPAMACPACYGFEKLEGKVHIEAGASEKQRKVFLIALSEAKDQLKPAYGALQATPVVLSCVTEACYQRIGGGKSEGQAIAGKVIRLSPRGLNKIILAHELHHIEFKQRAKRVGVSSGAPIWFVKGLAITLSGDQRYAGKPKDSEMAEDKVAKLKYHYQWNHAARIGPRVYAPAYRIVKDWYDKAGPDGLKELISRIEKGENFNIVYAELGDRP